jgi:hypothetical protein
VRGGRRSGKRDRFWKRRRGRTRAECGVLVYALFLFEGARLEGDGKRHWEGDDICLHCQANRGRGT